MSIFDSTLSTAMEVDIFAGGDPTQPQNNTPSAENKPVLNQTPDITEIDDNVEEEPDAPQYNTQENEEDLDGEDDSLDDEDDDGLGDSEDTSGQMGSDQNPDDVERKIALRKLICALHAAYSSSLNSLQLYNPPSNPALNAKYYALQDKMNDAKTMLFDLATNDMLSDKYEEILRKYAALNELYSICVEYLNTILIDNNPKSKKSKDQVDQ